MHENQKEWQVLFGVTIYDLWRDRNKLVFDSMTNLHQGNHGFLYAVQNQVNFIRRNYMVNGMNSAQSIRHLIGVAWSPPPSGCYKVNIDGSHSGGVSACGRLIRQGDGSFV